MSADTREGDRSSRHFVDVKEALGGARALAVSGGPRDPGFGSASCLFLWVPQAVLHFPLPVPLHACPPLRRYFPVVPQGCSSGLPATEH